MSSRIRGSSSVTGVTSLTARASRWRPPEPPLAELLALPLLEVELMDVEEVPCKDRARLGLLREPTGEQPGELMAGGRRQARSAHGLSQDRAARTRDQVHTVSLVEAVKWKEEVLLPNSLAPESWCSVSQHRLLNSQFDNEEGSFYKYHQMSVFLAQLVDTLIRQPRGQSQKVQSTMSVFLEQLVDKLV